MNNLEVHTIMITMDHRILCRAKWQAVVVAMPAIIRYYHTFDFTLGITYHYPLSVAEHWPVSDISGNIYSNKEHKIQIGNR